MYIHTGQYCRAAARLMVHEVYYKFHTYRWLAGCCWLHTIIDHQLLFYHMSRGSSLMRWYYRLGYIHTVKPVEVLPITIVAIQVGAVGRLEVPTIACCNKGVVSGELSLETAWKGS